MILQTQVLLMVWSFRRHFPTTQEHISESLHVLDACLEELDSASNLSEKEKRKLAEKIHYLYATKKARSSNLL